MAAAMESMDRSLKCSISNFSATQCSLSKMYPKELTTVKLIDCKKNIITHLSKLKILNNIESEGHLIAARTGIFCPSLKLTVCPHHRYSLGIHWRPNTKCSYPDHTGDAKPYRAVGLQMSQVILEELGYLVPIGSGN